MPFFQPPRTLVHLRYAWATAVLILLGGLGLWRGLGEPSAGWRFEVDAQQRIRAVATRGSGAQVLEDVTALRSTTAPAQRSANAPDARATLTPHDLIESPGVLNAYADQARFFERQRVLWALLQAPAIVIEQGGRDTQHVTTTAVLPKTLLELGPRFWAPWTMAMLSLTVGLGLWIYRPGQLAALCYLGASLSYAFGMMVSASCGSRLLTQAPTGWSTWHTSAHVAQYLIGLSLVCLLWWHPRRLYPPHTARWRQAWLPLALLLLDLWSALADGLEWLDTMTWTFRIPTLMAYIALMLAFTLQWHACRQLPIQRLQLRWFGMLMLVSMSILFVASALASSNIIVPIPQNYGYCLLALLFLGTVPLVARLGWFQLEAWWTRLWVWFLAGLLVIALDLALLSAAPWFSNSLGPMGTLSLALAAAGWLYFPLRQALWSRLMRHTVATPQDLLPAIVRLASCERSNSVQMHKLWTELWELSCQPLRVERGHTAEQAVDDTPPSAPMHQRTHRVWVSHGGEALHIPAPHLAAITETTHTNSAASVSTVLPPLTLWLPGRGSRLFHPTDLQQAEEIVQLVSQALASNEAFERGAQLAREQLMRDMHDGLGAQLMSALRGVERGAMPREQVLQALQDSLDDLRLLMDSTDMGRELTGALAAWRSRWSPRLESLGIAMAWEVDHALDTLPLPPDTVLQIMRIVQEATVNTVKHAQAQHMILRAVLAQSPNQRTLLIEIQDDGVGLFAQAKRPGARGLLNMVSRAQQTGAQLSVTELSTPLHGTRVTLRLTTHTLPH
jgi:signal transduction histidine kinase